MKTTAFKNNTKWEWTYITQQQHPISYKNETVNSCLVSMTTEACMDMHVRGETLRIPFPPQIINTW